MARIALEVDVIRVCTWMMLGGLVACGGGNRAGRNTTCVFTLDCADGSKLDSCANAAGQCWYEIDGAVYDCDAGCDCASAAEDATTDCMAVAT